MNNTKKGFMYAGGIIGIICGAICIFSGIIFLLASKIVTFDFVKEIIDAMNETATTAEELIVFSDAQINMVVRISKIVTILIGLYSLAMGIANCILSKKVIKHGALENNAKGCVIALLVLSILIGNVLTMAFMIVALCLKFKSKQEAGLETATQLTTDPEITVE